MGWRSRSAAAALVAASCLGAWAFAGCSEVLGIESNRYLAEAGAGPDGSPAPDAGGDASDAQVVDSGLPPNWQCIDTPVPPTPDASLPFEIFISDVSGMQTSGSFAGTPIVDAQVQACDRLDFACSSPLQQATTDDGGIARMTLPGGFNGFYTLVASGYISSLSQRPAQLVPELSQNAMVTPTTLTLGESFVGAMQDSNNAVAIVSIEDCSSAPALGATVEVSNPASKEQVVYFQDRFPTAAATATDVTGSAIIFNVPPGSMTVTGYFAGHHAVRAPMTALTRSGGLTFIQIRPDQATVTPP